MQLHAAASRGDVEAIASALRRGAGVNGRDSRGGLGRTALAFALDRARAFSGRVGPSVTLEAIGLLLDAGADLELADDLGATAIHHAAGIPDPAFVSLLADRGGNPRHVTKSGYSVILHACFQPASSAKRAIIRQLHEAGAPLDTRSKYGEFALGACLRFGDFETLQLLIDLGADPGPLDWAPLHHAVALGSPGDVGRSNPSPMAINSRSDHSELSPWLLSFVRGDVEIIRLLAEFGADLTQAGRCGQSPLHLAAEFGREAAISWLLDLGTDPDMTDEFGSTPLHLAAEGDHLSCAATLLDRSADAASSEGHGQSQPIHAAKSQQMIQLLVGRGGADVNAIDGCGDWPLKSAAESNDLNRISWLLNHGGEVDLTSTGETALHAAVRADSREAVEFLLEAGANPNAQDVDGWTPLFGAMSCEVIHQLLGAGADPRITDDAGGSPHEWLNDPILVEALYEKF